MDVWEREAFALATKVEKLEECTKELKNTIKSQPTEDELNQTMLRLVREAWRLQDEKLEDKLPGLIRQGIKAERVDEEETRKRILEQEGVGKAHPIKMFVQKNYGWIVAMLALVAILKPSLAGAALKALFAI